MMYRTVTSRRRASVSRALSVRARLAGARGAVCLAAVVAVALLGAGCSSSAGKASGKKSLTIGLDGAGTSLNPAVDTPGNQIVMRALAYEPLVHIKPDGTPSPALATSWRYIGTGNTTFEVTLRKDARFSDGTPVTADAVKTWLLYWSKTSPNSASLGKIQSIDSSDPYIFTIRLAAANPSLPYFLSDLFSAGAIASPKAVANPSVLGTGTDGAGQYELNGSATVTGDHYTFAPNKYYYDKSQVKFTSVSVKVIPNATSMLQAATTGQVDIAVGDSTTADAAAKSGLAVDTVQTGTAAFFFTDLTGKLAPALGDVRVRQALNYALDRAAITKGLIGTYGAPSSELLTSDGFDAAYQDHYSYDPVKAKALLAAAGYGSGLKLPVLVGGYQGQLGEPLALAVAKYLSEVGVTLQITNDATQAQFNKDAFAGTFPIVQSPWGGLMSPTYLTLFAPTAVMNYFHASDGQLDSLYQQAAVGSNPSTLFQQMSAVATDHALSLPILNTKAIWFVSKRLGGVQLGNLASVPLPAELYWTS